MVPVKPVADSRCIGCLLACCSRRGVGGREAAVDRGGGGGAAAGHGGARQDPLHRALPHRRLLLGGQGIIVLKLSHTCPVFLVLLMAI